MRTPSKKAGEEPPKRIRRNGIQHYTGLGILPVSISQIRKDQNPQALVEVCRRVLPVLLGFISPVLGTVPDLPNKY